jgi:hypothetical protein
MVLGECYFYQIVPTNFANEWLGGIKEESVYYLRQASSACERQEHNTGEVLPKKNGLQETLKAAFSKLMPIMTFEPLLKSLSLDRFQAQARSIPIQPRCQPVRRLKHKSLTRQLILSLRLYRNARCSFRLPLNEMRKKEMMT